MFPRVIRCVESSGSRLHMKNATYKVTCLPRIDHWKAKRRRRGNGRPLKLGCASRPRLRRSARSSRRFLKAPPKCILSLARTSSPSRPQTIGQQSAQSWHVAPALTAGPSAVTAYNHRGRATQVGKRDGIRDGLFSESFLGGWVGLIASTVIIRIVQLVRHFEIGDRIGRVGWTAVTRFHAGHCNSTTKSTSTCAPGRLDWTAVTRFNTGYWHNTTTSSSTCASDVLRRRGLCGRPQWEYGVTLP